MPQKMSKAEFARLVQEMPGASQEEIFAEAQRREGYSPLEREVAGLPQAQEEPGMLQKAWEWARTPLTTAPSEAASAVANSIDQRSLNESKLGAQLKGFAAGALEGAGNLVSSLTSPLDLALTLTGFGGAAAGRKGMLGISQAARTAEKALLAPVTAEGVYNVGSGIAEGDIAKAAMGAVQTAGGAAGIKTAGTHSFPPAKVRDAYMKSKGRANVAPAKVDAINPEFSKQVADAYQAMPHTPDDPRVAAAYQAMADETSDQFAFLRDQAGVKMEPWTAEGQPYANSAEMMADVRDNNRLFYFPSEGGFGSVEAQGGNPLLRPGKSGVPVNDEFRASHDYFGHAVEGNQFGPLGEERAYQAHRTMFPDEAVPALTTETRGQNSWVNYGPHLRDASGNIPKKGEPGFVRPQDRPFAEQKTGLLPEHLTQTANRTPQQDFQTSLTDGSPFGILTAANPGGRVLSPEENAQRMAQLLQELDARGLKPINQKGVYGGEPEPSLMVPGLSAEDSAALGRQFGQDAVITHEGWHRLGDDAKFPRLKAGFDQTADNYYSEVDLPGGPLKYQFEFPEQAYEPAVPKVGKDTSGTPMESARPVGRDGLSASGKDSTFGADPDTRAVSRMAGDVPPEFHAVESTPAPSKKGLSHSTALAVAAPGAAVAIPDDPDSKLDDYGRIGLGLAGMAGMAAARSKPLTGQKAHATQGAGLMLAGVSKMKDWGSRMLQAGVPKEQLNHIYRAASKLVEKEAAKAGGELNSAKKLLKSFETGQGEMKWYDDTFKELQTFFGKDAEMVAGFLTATSINATVKSNISLAMKAYKQWKVGEEFSGYLPSVIDELNRVKSGQPLAGRKLDNFRRAILGDPDAVVVDRWMLRAFGDNKRLAATPTQYDLYENAIKELAKQRGVTPRQMQAAIWFGVKNAAEKGKARPESPSFEAGIRSRLNADYDEAVKANTKIDAKRKNPQLFD